MYTILYHPSVRREDFKKLNGKTAQRILNTLYKKLSKEPEAFGRPLVGDLKGYYRLRIDPYRVIYRVEKARVIVFILKIGFRRDSEVYLQAVHRLKLFSD